MFAPSRKTYDLSPFRQNRSKGSTMIGACKPNVENRGGKHQPMRTYRGCPQWITRGGWGWSAKKSIVIESSTAALTRYVQRRQQHATQILQVIRRGLAAERTPCIIPPAYQPWSQTNSIKGGLWAIEQDSSSVHNKIVHLIGLRPSLSAILTFSNYLLILFYNQNQSKILLTYFSACLPTTL